MSGGSFIDIVDGLTYGGSNTQTLNIPVAYVSLSGTEYRCSLTASYSTPVFSNIGTLTSVIVENPASPQIVFTNPSNTTTTATIPTSFTVPSANASNGETVEFQWQVSGGSFSDIVGANSQTLAIDSPVTGDNGKQYRCVLTALNVQLKLKVGQKI